jgi:hypothetical protein
MATETKTAVPTKLLEQLETAMDNIAKGIRDPKAAAQACKDMDRMREDLRKRVGNLNVAVDLIRETHDDT